MDTTPLAQADAVRSAVSSVATCSPATTALLKSLLLPKDDASTATTTSTNASTSAPKASRSRAKATTTKSNKSCASTEKDKDGLSTRDKAALATQVVNATLRALGEAAKPSSSSPNNPPASTTPTSHQADCEQQQQQQQQQQPGKRQKLLRTSSVPMTPLQPRSLNRVCTSPTMTRHARSPSKSPSTNNPNLNNTNILSTVECARIAFAALRQIHSSGRISLPELQLETGMSALVGKLITLGLHEAAIKELRILKKKLDGSSKGSTTATTKQGTFSVEAKSTAVQAFAQILDFGEANGNLPEGAALSLIITTQIQTLRILSALKKPAYTEVAVPYLAHTRASSPTNLLLSAAAGAANSAAKGGKPTEIAKIARQMETLSQVLFSLTPNVSSKEDDTAAESRLNISPTSALELQTLALEARLHWWRLANHKGDVDWDVLLPFSRCLGAYVRRSQGTSRVAYSACAAAFQRVDAQVSAYGGQPAKGSKFPLAGVYQTLVTLAREAGMVSDAVKWAGLLYSQSQCQASCQTQSAAGYNGNEGEGESIAKSCSLAAQLLALHLKHPEKYLTSDELLCQVLEGIQGPLRGDTAELDELLSNVCLVRRFATNYLISLNKPAKQDKPAKSAEGAEGGGGVYPCSAKQKDLLERFILRCPRFCLRWLGKPPEPKASTREYLRYEQRRKVLAGEVKNVVDSAFMVFKSILDRAGDGMDWEVMEGFLGDVMGLLDCMGDFLAGGNAGRGEGGGEGASTSYHVKISHFWYVQYSMLRQQQQQQQGNGKDFKDPAAAMRALRRSVECVKGRSSAEKERAQLVLKLERLAEMCKTLGRGDQALGALQAIRTSLVEDGVLGLVAGALATSSLDTAWTRDDKIQALSRALFSIARMETVWVDWTVDLDEMEQAAVLEHRLRFILLAGGGKGREEVGLEHSCVDSLLRIYIPTRFPVRRLRVLLALLCEAVGDAGKVGELRGVVHDAAQVERDGALGEDAGLGAFIPHMKALYHSLTALVDGYPDLAVLDRSVATWRFIVTPCQSRGDLEKAVDNVSSLLDHLESVADFLRMKGQDIMLATVLELAADISRAADGPKPEDPIKHDAYLALQYTSLGKSAQAQGIFSRAEEYLGLHDHIPGEALASLHLALTEHHIALGNLNSAEEHLAQARTAVGAETSLQRVPRARRKHLIAHAAYLHSVSALQRGDSHHALAHSRESVRVLYQDWLRLEAAQVTSKDSPDTSTTTMDDATINLSVLNSHQQTNISGPELWRLFPRLYRNLVRLSSIYAHLGMFQETMYYAEQAQKMALSADSEFYKADCAAWMGAIFTKAGNPARALEFLQDAAGRILPPPAGENQNQSSYASAGLACRVGSMYLDLGQAEGAERMIERAEAVLGGLAALGGKSDVVEDAVAVVEEKMAKLKIESKPARATRKTAAAAKAPAKRAPRGAAAAKTKAKAVPVPKEVVMVEDAGVSKLRASILVQKAAATLSKRDWTTALSILKNAAAGTSSSTDLLLIRQVTTAACLLGMSMEQMSQDPVFSVLQDSTISFPAVSAASHDNRITDRHLLAPSSSSKTTPPRNTRATPAAAQRSSTSSSPASSMGAYVESLKEAQDHLLEAHSVATLSGEASLVHRISVMLQNVGLLLAATSSKERASIHSGHTAYSVELARNLTWRRERKALVLEKNAKQQQNAGTSGSGHEWPAMLESASTRRSSLGFLLDLSRFQRDYIDIIPHSWSVISISLSENNHDLCITKLQAGMAPFVIRLPLERASSRDADNAVFNFLQGRNELLEIINKVNETCHSTRDMSAKGAKSAWWKEREELDERLRELLESIESIWLGGFRGIFFSGERRTDLLGLFRDRFLEILDKHLPSRRRVIRGRKGKGTATAAASGSAGGVKVNLDPRILELFVGLGDANLPGCDFDDELTDLLYFVVDILQFHGERNAYDEIDFDSMVVETMDALRAYHAAAAEANTEEGPGAAQHAILLLDKSLHVFPWESLPCLRDCAVSRMPSLVCLRRLITEQKELQQRGKAAKGKEKEQRPSTPVPSSGDETESSSSSSSAARKQGHRVSLSSGTIILNPSGDLKSTQATFEQPLSRHLPAGTTGWKKIIARPPTETEFETALSSSDMLLYFGHGSGAQYIRGKTIRKLDRCRATVLLMGCSSAKLADCGEFEPHGPAWNYMMAGCPAVVGTLWDVTDRDIDRFTGRLLEEWGVLPPETAGKEPKSRGKKKGTSGKASLVQAVNRARGVCKFRYVNAASVVVYGIPVHVDK